MPTPVDARDGRRIRGPERVSRDRSALSLRRREPRPTRVRPGPSTAREARPAGATCGIGPRVAEQRPTMTAGGPAGHDHMTASALLYMPVGIEERPGRASSNLGLRRGAANVGIVVDTCGGGRRSGNGISVHQLSGRPSGPRRPAARTCSPARANEVKHSFLFRAVGSRLRVMTTAASLLDSREEGAPHGHPESPADGRPAEGTIWNEAARI